MKYGHKHAVLSSITPRPIALKLSFKFFLRVKTQPQILLQKVELLDMILEQECTININSSTSFNSASYFFSYCKMKM